MNGTRLPFNIHRNGDVELVAILQIGNHGALEFLTLNAKHKLPATQSAGNDIEAFSLGAIEKAATVSPATLGNSCLNRLRKKTNAAFAGKFHTGFGRGSAGKFAGETGVFIRPGNNCASTRPRAFYAGKIRTFAGLRRCSRKKGDTKGNRMGFGKTQGDS